MGAASNNALVVNQRHGLALRDRLTEDVYFKKVCPSPSDSTDYFYLSNRAAKHKNLNWNVDDFLRLNMDFWGEHNEKSPLCCGRFWYGAEWLPGISFVV